jgi:hypothetical protein
MVRSVHALPCHTWQQLIQINGCKFGVADPMPSGIWGKGKAGNGISVDLLQR